MKTSTLILACVLALSACTDMKDQPRYEPLEASTFFADGRAARPLVEGTVARGHLKADDHLYRGLAADGTFATEFPFPVTAQVLARGRERFDIFCSPCHGQTGYGDGMIVQRGYKQPPSFHTDRARGLQAGYVFDVISNGFGVMASYAAQVKTEDRWAIVAYLRALQWSQNAPVDAVPADVRTQLEHGLTVSTELRSEEGGHGDDTRR